VTATELLAICADVRYHNWKFHVGPMGTDGFFIQVKFTAPDNQTHALNQSWSGRKWYVSPHATRSEVVLTCLKAVLTALEHEAREQFTYKGVALFQPHVNIDQLMKAASYYEFRPLPAPLTQGDGYSDPAPRTDISGNEMVGP